METIENFHNHMNAAIAFHNEEVRNLRRLILRACAELETVEYENDPPARVAALMDELREVNRASLVSPNDRVEGRDAAPSRRVPSHDGLEGNGTGRHE